MSMQGMPLTKWMRILNAVVLGATFWACTGKNTAGTSEESEGLYAVKDLEVAGVTQKGPFVKGSAVTVRGIDCQTMKPTDEIFEGTVKSDKGDFAIGGVTLKSSCAIFEVTGRYLNELSGKESSEQMTLRVLTDLKNRKTVNVNILTHLEYDRLKSLVVGKKMTLAEAKVQAEREVLAAFDVAATATEFEDMNILEPGSDNAALLAVSVLMQADADVAEVAERTDKAAASLARNGLWDDAEAKKEIADWALGAEASGELEAIRRNIKGWSDAGVAPSFENIVENFGEAAGRNPYLNPEVEYDSLVDVRDGRVYSVMKIGGQVWMAENLDYFDTVAVPGLRDSSWCYDNNSAKCAEAGRLYTWSVARAAVCPDGWHLPDTTEWNALIAAAGGSSAAASALKSPAGWDDGNGTNSSGFSAVAAGERYRSGSFDSEGLKAYMWSADNDPEDNQSAYGILIGSDDSVTLKSFPLANGFAVRCVMD